MLSQGATLALLLLSGFRQMAGEATAELSRRGFPGITVANDFAMRAIAGGADNASELARRLGLTKQASAKAIATLEQRGYVERVADPKDARRKLVTTRPRRDARRRSDHAGAADRLVKEGRAGRTCQARTNPCHVGRAVHAEP
jgi:DNA-binding MarR family transcriptional regulator